MSTDVTRSDPHALITVQGNIVNPDTGEVTTLEDTPTLVLARVLGFVQHGIDSQLRALYDAKHALGGEMITRMDKTGEWTVNAPGVTVTAPSPTAGSVEWDAVQLEAILDELVEEGLLNREGKRRAVTQEIVLKVDKRGVTALMKIPAVAARIIEARRFQTKGDRRASVRVDPRHL